MELLIDELEDSKAPKLFYKTGRKPFACLERSSIPDRIAGRCCVMEARVIEGANMASLRASQCDEENMAPRKLGKESPSGGSSPASGES